MDLCRSWDPIYSYYLVGFCFEMEFRALSALLTETKLQRYLAYIDEAFSDPDVSLET